MSTSGVTTYQLTASDIINAAYRKTGVMAKGQVADSEELTYGLQALNLLIPQLRTLGMELWKLEQDTLSITAGVQTYTVTQPNKPNKIQQAWISPINSGTKIPIEMISIFDMNMLPSTSSGVPVKLSYIPSNTTGSITIWPSPTSTVVSQYTFYYQSVQELQVVTDVSQTMDFPTEWHLPIVYGIASAMAIELNVPLQDREQINKMYENAVAVAISGDQENAPLFVQPRREW